MGYAVLNYEGSDVVKTNRMIGSLEDLLPGEYYSEEEVQVGQRPLSSEEVLQIALDKRDSLLTLAAIRIAPLQDAADLDDATPSEVALLKKWKQYRVAVNRLPDQEGFPVGITWPVEPS